MVHSATKPLVLLINPPVYDFAFYDQYVKPYGLLRIARWLREGGYDIHHINALDYEDSASKEALGSCRRKADGSGKMFRQILDLPGGIRSIPRYFSRYGVIRESLEARMKSLPRRPDLVLISSGMTYWYKGVVEMTEMCRKLFPGVPLGIGGIYATLMRDHCQTSCAPDFITEGPAWPSLLKSLEAFGLPLPSGQPGLYPLTDDPVWKDSAVIRLNEGCPFLCDYCGSRSISPSFRKGSHLEALDFAETVYRQFGTVNFAFYDDALLVNWDTVLGPFLEGVLSRNLPLRFYNPNALHIRYLDRDRLNLMMRAGFQEIRMGYESGDDDFHEQSDRKSSLGDFHRAVQAIRESDFPLERTGVYILAGLPGQSPDDVEVSIRKAAATGVRCRIAQYSPVPQTALWKESVRLSSYPLEEEPLYHNNCFFPLEREGFDRKKMEELKRLSARLSHKNA